MKDETREHQLVRALEQAIGCVILDNDYRSDLRPTNGHAPIRHQIAFEWAEEALGKKRFEELIKSLDLMPDRGPCESWGRRYVKVNG